jgi:hypothetical protein
LDTEVLDTEVLDIEVLDTGALDIEVLGLPAGRAGLDFDAVFFAEGFFGCSLAGDFGHDPGILRRYDRRQ